MVLLSRFVQPRDCIQNADSGQDKDAFAFHPVQYPPSIRVMDKDEGKEQEVVMKMIGVMCGGILPPVQRQL
jgi:hypothetical protein